jgi:anti-anti-sigma regulatory factor
VVTLRPPDPEALPEPVAVRHGEHACCRFARPADRRRVVVGLLRAGLDRRHRLLYLIDAGDAGSVGAALAAADPVIAAALAGEQLGVRALAEVHAPDGGFDVDGMLAAILVERDRAIQDGNEGLTLAGDIGDAVSAAGGSALLEEYERRLDALQIDHASLLCQYDPARFGPGPLARVGRCHDVDLAPELAAIGRECCLAAGRLPSGVLRLAGRLDFDSAPTLERTLDAHERGARRMDLDDVSYADVAGMRALRGRSGQRLAITSASPAVRRLVALLAWDSDPLVTIAATA